MSGNEGLDGALAGVWSVQTQRGGWVEVELREKGCSKGFRGSEKPIVHIELFIFAFCFAFRAQRLRWEYPFPFPCGLYWVFPSEASTLVFTFTTGSGSAHNRKL